MRKTIVAAIAVAVCCAALSASAFGQAFQKQYVAEFGVAFTQATVTKAQMGFVGLDLAAARMLSNNISVGLAIGFDNVSLQKTEGMYERLAVVPVLAKAKYYLNVAPLMQLHASVMGGIYKTIPHLGIDPVGGIWEADIRPGGGAGIGFDYWFLGSKGISAEFEYNFFDSGTDELFSYFAIRLNYAIARQ